MNWKRSSACLVALLCCLLCFIGVSAGAENLLRNPGFEQLGSDGLPSGWNTGAYFQMEGYTLYSVSNEARTGSVSAGIQNLAENDARFWQTVEVEPESLYCLSGWVRTEDVSDFGRGANVSIEGLYVFSNSVYGTSDGWQYIELYGETGEDQTDVTVYVRLGGYSGESDGKAWFDDICLEQVQAVPGSGTASLWFSPSYSYDDYGDDYDDDESEETSAYWPQLLLISLVWCIAALLLTGFCRSRMDRHDLTQDRRGPPLWFWIGLAVSAVIHLLVMLKVEGYQVDVNCFLSWGATMASTGPADFYQTTSFCDYPPAYVYILGLNGLMSRAVSSRVLQAAVYKLLPSLCNLLMALLAMQTAREEKLDRDHAAMIGLLVALNPALILNSAAWCQMDSVLLLLLALVCYCAMKDRWIWVMVLYMLAVLVKPQALMLGFLGVAAIVMTWIRKPEVRRQMLIGIAAALGTALAVIVPFSLHTGGISWLFELYGNTLSSYAYATVNTANLYYLFGGNWVAITRTAAPMCVAALAAICLAWSAWCYFRMRSCRLAWLEPVIGLLFSLAFTGMIVLHASWTTVGFTAMALAFAVVLPMFIRGGDIRHLPLMGALLFLLLFVLGIKMHERYLFPALIFLAMALAVEKDWRVGVMLLLATVTLFVNEGIVLDNSLRLGSSMGHLNNDTIWLANILAILNLINVAIGLWTGLDLCVLNARRPLHPDLPLRTMDHDPRIPGHEQYDSSLHFKRLDWVLMLSVTLVYAFVALWNLGSTKAPQNPWKSTAVNESVVIDLGDSYDGFTMLYFAQVSYKDFSVATSDDGVTWSPEHYAEMAQGQCWRWKYVCEYADYGGSRSYYSDPEYFEGRYVRITAQQVGLVLNEVIFRDEDGDAIPACVLSRSGENTDSPLLTDPEALLDEQDTLDGEPSWYNSTYFDEIYHARTAYEHANGTVPYETTHPPLGKVLMSWCVSLLGMTPFGWRFAGALTGILMLPVMYLLGKQLTKSTLAGFAAMCMMALDCMHLTQTRIATIDSFPVLFILVSYFFMLRFMQKDIIRTPLKKLVPELAMSGLFIGLAIASKWIGCYAAVGLAVLYFLRLGRALAAAYHMKRDPAAHDEDAQLRIRETTGRCLILCAWCVPLFVFVPVAIYLLSYIPYFAYTQVSGIREYLQLVIDAQVGMFNYHSTPGLGMDHPFYSPWYEWPLIQRPMYYAMAQFMEEGYSCSIFAFGNPAVWLTGLAGIAFTAFMWLKRHFYRLPDSGALLHAHACDRNDAYAFVLIGLAAQFLPWVLVPRGTYIYHYFASVPFLCLGTMLLLHRLTQRKPKLGRIVTAIYLVICLIMFVAFYPYASGMTVPEEWLDFMSRFLHLYHA